MSTAVLDFTKLVDRSAKGRHPDHRARGRRRPRPSVATFPRPDLQQVAREKSRSLGRMPAGRSRKRSSTEYHAHESGPAEGLPLGRVAAKPLIAFSPGLSARPAQRPCCISSCASMNWTLVAPESLQKADPKQLARLLEAEHPQTVALVLGHLEPRQASAVLTQLPRRHARRIRSPPRQSPPVLPRHRRAHLRAPSSAACAPSATLTNAPTPASRTSPHS